MRNGSNGGGEGKRSTKKDPPHAVEEGSGNVFADLGFKHPELMQAKAKLVQRIRAVIAERGLVPAQAAALLGIDEPKVALLVRGRVGGFTLDRMYKFLTALGQRIDISVHPATIAPSSAKR